MRTMLMLTMMALLAVTASAQTILYSETFDTDPGWSLTWTPTDGEFAQWTGDAYEVRTGDDDPLQPRYAYTAIPQVGDENFQLELDFLFTEISWGQPVMIAFHNSSADWLGDDFFLHWDDSHSNSDGLRVRSTCEGGNVDIQGPHPALNVWYSFAIEFDVMTGTASWRLVDRASGTILWEASDQNLPVGMLDSVGIGCSVVNGEGQYSGVMVDNITVTAGGVVAVDSRSLSQVKALFN